MKRRKCRNMVKNMFLARLSLLSVISALSVIITNLFPTGFATGIKGTPYILFSVICLGLADRIIGSRRYYLSVYGLVSGVLAFIIPGGPMVLNIILNFSRAVCWEIMRPLKYIRIIAAEVVVSILVWLLLKQIMGINMPMPAFIFLFLIPHIIAAVIGYRFSVMIGERMDWREEK